MRKLETNAVIFLALLFGLGLANALDTHRLAVSQVENRVLRAKPRFSLAALASGDYLRAYEDYFSDRFVFRERLVNAAMALKALEQTGTGGTKLVSYTGDNSADLSAASSSAAGSVVTENGMIIVNGRAMSVHYFDAAAAQHYAGVVNALATAVGPKVRVCLLLVPSSTAFYAGDAFKSITSSQETTSSYVDGFLSSSVTPVDALRVLHTHSSECIYFRTDHHWTALAAYYAYTEFMRVTGRKAVPLSRYRCTELEGFLGSSYSATLDSTLSDTPDTVDVYIPYLDYAFTIDGHAKPLLDLTAAARDKGKYEVFMGGDHPVSILKSSAKTGRRLLMVKDSNGNAFIPFLLPHFEEIVAVDPRSYHGSLTDLAHGHAVTDVLVLNGIGAASARPYADFISALTPAQKH